MYRLKVRVFGSHHLPKDITFDEKRERVVTMEKKKSSTQGSVPPSPSSSSSSSSKSGTTYSDALLRGRTEKEKASSSAVEPGAAHRKDEAAEAEDPSGGRSPPLPSHTISAAYGEDTATVKVSAGNPYIEVIKGVVHLYKDSTTTTVARRGQLPVAALFCVCAL